MNELREFWNKELPKWEELTYSQGIKLLAIHKIIFFYFKRPLVERLKTFLDLIGPYLKDKVVLDLGCGSGIFCFQLLQLGASKVVGVDVSDKAIEMAKGKARELNVDVDKCSFICADARNMVFPSFDIVTGLGFLDWIGLDETAKIFREIKGKRFLFSFSERYYSPLAVLHRLYWYWRDKISKQGVLPQHYTSGQIISILSENGFSDACLLRDRKLSFGTIIHNLH